MQDALAVRRVERFGDLMASVQQRLRSSGFPASLLVERVALEQLHRQQHLAVVFAERVNRADVRVIEARCGPCLAPEPLHRLVIFRRGPSEAP